MIDFYQIISPFYHHYNCFYTIKWSFMITLKYGHFASFCIIGYQQGIQGIQGFQGRGTRLPTEGRVHGRGVGDRAGALTLVEAVPLPPVTWRDPERPRETQRDPERPRIMRILSFVMNCYVLLTCYKNYFHQVLLVFVDLNFCFWKKNWLITWNTRTKDIGNSSANNRVRWYLRNPVRTQTLVVKLST